MSIILYNIVISPIEYILENLFSIFFQIIEFDLITSIFFISFVVSLLCLPFYCRADKIRKKEDENYSKIKPYVDKIKRNFKGDEQFFLLQTLYRQHNYNPIMALRKSFSLLLQIPFFIAAYHFFSNLELLNNYSWGIIKNFSQPDMLLSRFGFHINILPIIMTIINIISCEIYLNSNNYKSRIQPYSFAFIFLILLYNSPSALVIYWTFNNFFFLLKNKYMDTNPKAFVIILLSLCVFGCIFGNFSWFVDKDIFFYLKYLSLFFILFIVFKFYGKKTLNSFIFKEYSNNKLVSLFLLNAIVIVLLHGFIIPVGLITSDLSYFIKELDNSKNIITIIIENLFSFIGLYIFWGGIVFYFIKKQYRIFWVYLLISISFCSLFNYFNISKELGTIGPNLVFDDYNSVHRCFGNMLAQIPNLLLLILITVFVIYLLRKKFNILIVCIIPTILMSETIASAIYTYKLINGINYINNIKQSSSLSEPFQNKIELTQTGKNVLIIFLDRFAGCLLPMIFEEKPELKTSYSGFVFYPNTVSFYISTILGYPPCVGGYEYTPLVLDKDKRIFSEKWIESNLMLPVFFKNNNYLSSIVDPVVYFSQSMIINNEKPIESIYTSKGIKYIKMAGRYNTKLQLDLLNDLKAVKIIQKKFYLYSYFCTAPNLFKSFIYDNGNYLLSRNKGNKDSFFAEKSLIESYSSLLYLKDNTKISVNQNTFTLINNDLPHNMHFLQYPKYEYAKDVTSTGPNKFIDMSSFQAYHTAMASIILIANYLDYLKQEGVYDNSRIIIVSDHGNRFLTMPGYTDFQNKSVVPFNPLLMVKNFNQNFEIKTNNTFMTNADTPTIAIKNLVDKGTNPFTGKAISSDDKKNGVCIYINLFDWNPSDFTTARVILGKNPLIKLVCNNIFDETNWKRVIFTRN